MKCPFLIKRKEIFDESGNKVEEEIELLECIKNECMVYDSATKLCSLLSSNMKTGVLIDDIKNGLKDVSEEMSQGTSAISNVISTTIHTMQEGLLSRLDVQKKQIEVMILGFDKLQEAFSNNFNTLGTIINNHGDGLKSATQALQDRITEANNSNTQLLEKLISGMSNMNNLLRGEISGLKSAIIDIINSTAVKLEDLGKLLSTAMEEEKENNQNLIKTLEDVSNGLKVEVSGLRSDEAAIFGDFRQEVSNSIDTLKNEIINLKAGQSTSLNNLLNEFVQLRNLFTQSSERIVSIDDLMSELNKNYLESLGKIAGLTEGMRRSVEIVGEDMRDSVKGLIDEIKGSLGGIAKTYEQTFGDIATLVDKFDAMNNRIKEMTQIVELEFKESFDRQKTISDYTKEIFERIKTYFEKEEKKFEEEQELRKKKEALDHFDRSTLYYYRGNHELALNEVNRALDIDKTAEYLNLKGLILIELGKFEESKETYTEALQLEPDLAEIHNNLGLLYLKMKNYEDAVASFKVTVKKNINYAMGYVNLGKALIELERFDEAIESYNHALEIDPLNQEAMDAIKLYKEGKIVE